MKTLVRFTYSILITAMLSSCASNRAKDFHDVEIGSTKGQALAYFGNPDRTYRKNSRDHWVYFTKQSNGIRLKKVLIFSQGHLTEVQHRTPEYRKVRAEDFSEI